MSDNKERLMNLILSVIIAKQLIPFGGEEHIKVIQECESTDEINTILKSENTIIQKALKIINEDKKLSYIFNEIIEIDV